ncbi:MAG: hypothetical protein WC222_10225 [Parachlamydiales bacterium]|jgi:hypothetical protein
MHYIRAALAYSWVWISTLTIAVVYWYGHLRLVEEKHVYIQRYEMLQTQIAEVRQRQKKLNLLIQHQDNPQLIEWTLINYLGLIPEGTTKVLITKETDK